MNFSYFNCKDLLNIDKIKTDANNFIDKFFEKKLLNQKDY